MSHPAPTPTLLLLPPPGPSVLTHPLDVSLTSPASPLIPSAFSDSLAVRVRVFIHEQRCNPALEIDADDPRSWHWIAYAPSLLSSFPAAVAAAGAGSGAGASTPVATIRLIPPPHGPYPAPGSVDGVGGAWPPGMKEKVERRLGAEPYVVLGRLATLEAYRGRGLGRLLVETALGWAARNVGAVSGEGERWRGAVLISAQMEAEGFYRGVGFERDEDGGEWVEEGIRHVGMWRRVEVKGGGV
ncbi:hypothetical protein MMC13_004159 [Lambiella insularis]|nr:hypothetical protein [Lambiella insularis]